MHNIFIKVVFVIFILLSFNTLASEPTVITAPTIEELESQNYINVKRLQCFCKETTKNYQKGKKIAHSGFEAYFSTEDSTLHDENCNISCVDENMKPYTGMVFSTIGKNIYETWQLENGGLHNGVERLYDAYNFLAHEYFIKDGKIIKINYYYHGILNRTLKVKSPDIVEVKNYYPNGKLKKKYEYIKFKGLVKITSYYENGQLDEVNSYGKDKSKPQLLIKCAVDGECMDSDKFNAVKYINDIATNTSTLHTNVHNFAKLNNESAKSYGVIPSDMISSDKIVHPLGGTVDISPVSLNGEADGFTIAFNNVSTENCEFMQQQDWSLDKTGFVKLLVKLNDSIVSCQSCASDGCSLLWIFKKIR